MLGDGVTIDTADKAEGYTRAIRRNPEVWPGRGIDPDPVAVGEHLRLAPCVPDHWPGVRPGRRCPRVGLMRGNQAAAELVMAALYEHTRPLMPEYISARLGDMPPRERRLITMRVVGALHSDPVLTWLHPPRPEEAPS